MTAGSPVVRLPSYFWTNDRLAYRYPPDFLEIHARPTSLLGMVIFLDIPPILFFTVVLFS